MSIHPTAIVDSQATLGGDVSIGAFAIIEPRVVIGDGCVIGGHAQLLGSVTLGEGCQVGPGAVIGGRPQDRSYTSGLSSGVCIGRENDIREHVTIHRSAQEGGMTRLGDRNFLMVGAHVAHDCQIGDDNTLANHCLLGGHVQLASGIFMGGGAGIHQFVRVGARVMVHGHMACSLDLPPFVLAGGQNVVHGLNSVGMRRAGISADERAEVKAIYRLFYREKRSFRDAMENAEARSWGAAAEAFLEFLRGKSRKGICMRTADRA